MSGLDADTIKRLLEEDAIQSRRSGSGRKKADLTEDRSLPAWYRLNLHICTRDCPHRVDPNNPTRPDKSITESNSLANIGNACWNPDCTDPRDKENDRAANVVAEVKNQWICRFCYISGYLLSHE